MQNENSGRQVIAGGVAPAWDCVDTAAAAPDGGCPATATGLTVAPDGGSSATATGLTVAPDGGSSVTTTGLTVAAVSESAAAAHAGGRASCSSRHAVVIGGGIAGLMSAWALQRRGWRVTLLEAGAQVGGAVQTVKRGGYQAECGPNTMMVTSRRFEEAIAELGLQKEAVRPNASFKKRFLVRDGRLNAAPASFREFVQTPQFSLNAKLRLFGDLVWGAGLRNDLSEESLGSYFRRHFGAEVVDYAINPIIAGVYAGDADRLSLRHAFPFIWEAATRSRSVLRGVLLNLRDKRKSGKSFRSYMLGFKGGLATLPATLAAQLKTPPVTRVRVVAIDYHPDAPAASRWTVAYTVAAPQEDDSAQREGCTASQDGALSEKTAVAPLSGAGTGCAGQATVGQPDVSLAADCGSGYSAAVLLEADALVLAAPAHAVVNLPLPDALAQCLGVLREVEYPPVANVALGYRRGQVRHPLDGFGALLPAKEKAQVLGALFSSSVFPHVAPDGKVLLTTFIGGSRAPQLAHLPESKLVQHAHEQLAELLGIEGQPEFSQVTVWPKAIPQVRLGYGRILDAMDSAERSCRELAIVGNHRGEIALGKCAADAIDRAEALDDRMHIVR